MGKTATKIEGLEGEWGQYPQAVNFTLPARYKDYVEKISKIEGHKNLSDLFRSLLVEKYPVPASSLDEIDKLEEAQSKVNKKQRRQLQLAEQMRLQSEESEEE